MKLLSFIQFTLTKSNLAGWESWKKWAQSLVDIRGGKKKALTDYKQVQRKPCPVARLWRLIVDNFTKQAVCAAQPVCRASADGNVNERLSCQE